MFVFAREVLASGTSVVLEANFVSAYDAPRVAELRRDLNIHCAELHVSADTNVLLARYTKRAFSDERHVGHEDQRKVDDARSGILNGTWAPLGLGREVAVVDTTLEWPDEVRELIRELNRNAI
jgi:hypothetical protein